MDYTSSLTTAKWPSDEIILRGRFVALEPLAEVHIDELWPIVFSPEVVQATWWDYLHTPPITNYDALKEMIERRINCVDGIFYAIVDSLLRNAVGWVCLNHIWTEEKKADIGIFLPSPELQKTPRATDALYLLLHCAFEELGFETLYWKTDTLHAASRQAAARLGFTLERVVEDEAVVSGNSTEMAIYTLRLERWNVMRFALARWVDQSNFDEDGKQKRRLQELVDEPS